MPCLLLSLPAVCYPPGASSWFRSGSGILLCRTAARPSCLPAPVVSFIAACVMPAALVALAFITLLRACLLLVIVARLRVIRLLRLLVPVQVLASLRSGTCFTSCRLPAYSLVAPLLPALVASSLLPAGCLLPVPACCLLLAVPAAGWSLSAASLLPVCLLYLGVLAGFNILRDVTLQASCRTCSWVQRGYCPCAFLCRLSVCCPCVCCLPSVPSRFSSPALVTPQKTESCHVLIHIKKHGRNTLKAH